MYVRRRISARHLLADSWLFLVFVTLWSVLVVVLNEVAGLHFISIPIIPVTTIGIAVSLYLGFKSTSAYNRWWEAREVWGEIASRSRDFANSVFNLITGELPDPGVRAELIRRHLAFVNALAFQVRSRSRLRESPRTRIFGHRRVFADGRHHQTRDAYRKHLSAEEAAAFEAFANPAAHILRRQGDTVRRLAELHVVDSRRHSALMALLGAFYTAQGRCERIKNTPFPRQVAHFGLLFTWVFILLLPLAFVDLFEADARFHSLTETASTEYVFVMVPFTVLISWVFFIMEKVSDSTEDPFEGGVTDVPVSAICRMIEIDLLQMLGEAEIPPAAEPVDGVLY